MRKFIKLFEEFKNVLNENKFDNSYWFEVANSTLYGMHGNIEDQDKNSLIYRMHIKEDDYTLRIYQNDIKGDIVWYTTLVLTNNKNKKEAKKDITKLKMPNDPSELGEYLSKFIPKLISEVK
jgi:hypothetical protein